MEFGGRIFDNQTEYPCRLEMFVAKVDIRLLDHQVECSHRLESLGFAELVHSLLLLQMKIPHHLGCFVAEHDQCGFSPQTELVVGLVFFVV